MRTAIRSSAQKLGALAVDRTVVLLGLGRGGVRLTEIAGGNTDHWEAETDTWTSAAVVEACELLAGRSLLTTFDLQGGEVVAVESLNLRWLGPQRPVGGGRLTLNWDIEEREFFRRRVLENLATGTTVELTIVGRDSNELSVVEVDLWVRARARVQLSAKR